jgi:hypothetical protein
LDELQYVRQYEEKEGISLDPETIERNEGLRSLSKLMANSHWGKFGENPSRSQFTYVSDPAQYIKMMTDNTIEVQDLEFVNEEYVGLKWKSKVEFQEGLTNVNVVLAAYTTAQARLKLYSLLEKLDTRVLYFDTDSVVYISRQGLWDPPLGDYLGELKDETKGVPITRFVSGGPKNYAYQLLDGSTVCKIRGFTLNHRTSLILNFEKIKEMVLNTENPEIVETVDPNRLIRNPDGTMYTKPLKKSYKLVYDKRWLAPEGFYTYPYGYNPT